MKVELRGQIKDFGGKRFVSGDYGIRIILDSENTAPADMALLSAMFASEINQQKSLKITIEDKI